jgi:chromate transporter
MQLATYVGWRLHGTIGGLAADLLFVLPGAFVVLLLSIAYAYLGKVPIVETAFLGVKAAVLVIVVEALLRVAKRALRGPYDIVIAAAAFVGIFFFAAPFPLIIVAAAAIGWVMALASPRPATAAADNPEPVPLTRTLKTAVLWLVIWIGPLLLVATLLGRDHVTTQIALFFSKLAVVTFGGAYSVLAYMAQQAVETTVGSPQARCSTGLVSPKRLPARLSSSLSSWDSSPASATVETQSSPSACLVRPSPCGQPSHLASSGSLSARLTSSA